MNPDRRAILESDTADFSASSQPHKYIVEDTKIDGIAATICQLLGLEQFEVSISFVSSEEIAELNFDYRQKTGPTDVLSFPQIEWSTPVLASTPGLRAEQIMAALPLNAEDADEESEPALLGDVIICLDIANQNAEKIGQSLAREVCFLIVHGILHLCGHDHEHEEEEKIMLYEQDFIMGHLKELGDPWLEAVVPMRLN
jgi:probable rRNA maturation factor